MGKPTKIDFWDIAMLANPTVPKTSGVYAVLSTLDEDMRYIGFNSWVEDYVGKFKAQMKSGPNYLLDWGKEMTQKYSKQEVINSVYYILLEETNDRKAKKYWKNDGPMFRSLTERNKMIRQESKTKSVNHLMNKYRLPEHRIRRIIRGPK